MKIFDCSILFYLFVLFYNDKFFVREEMLWLTGLNMFCASRRLGAAHLFSTKKEAIFDLYKVRWFNSLIMIIQSKIFTNHLYYRIFIDISWYSDNLYFVLGFSPFLSLPVPCGGVTNISKTRYMSNYTLYFILFCFLQFCFTLC